MTCKLTVKTKINVKSIATIALVIVAISSVATSYGAVSANQNVTPKGSVTGSAGLGVYSNSACTIPLSSISWGNITAGTNVQRTIFLKNTSKAPH